MAKIPIHHTPATTPTDTAQTKQHTTPHLNPYHTRTQPPPFHPTTKPSRQHIPPLTFSLHPHDLSQQKAQQNNKIHNQKLQNNPTPSHLTPLIAHHKEKSPTKQSALHHLNTSTSFLRENPSWHLKSPTRKKRTHISFSFWKYLFNQHTNTYPTMYQTNIYTWAITNISPFCDTPSHPTYKPPPN